MVSIAELIAEHRALERQAEVLLEVVARDVPDTAAVAAIRWQICHDLLEHCAGEDQCIYQRLLASGDVEATRLAWECRRRIGGSGVMFRAFIADWPVDRVRREWTGFREETRRVLDCIAERSATEENILYPQVERVLARRAA